MSGCFPRHDTLDSAPDCKGPLSMHPDARFKIVRKRDNGSANAGTAP